MNTDINKVFYNTFTLEQIEGLEAALKLQYPAAPFDKIKADLLNDPSSSTRKKHNYYGMLQSKLAAFKP